MIKFIKFEPLLVTIQTGLFSYGRNIKLKENTADVYVYKNNFKTYALSLNVTAYKVAE